jgi:hypothetical protein
MHSWSANYKVKGILDCIKYARQLLSLLKSIVVKDQWHLIYTFLLVHSLSRIAKVIIFSIDRHMAICIMNDDINML